MKRITLDVVAFDCGVQKIEIEEGVMPDEDRSLAAGVADLAAYVLKKLAQCSGLVDRGAQWMVGVDSGHL